MPVPFRVIQIGFGTLGKWIAKAIIERENLDLVAVVDIDPALQGKEVEELLKLDRKTSTKIRESLSKTLDELQGNPPDVAVVATASHLQKIKSTISTCLQRGMDVISLCEELSYPYVRHPDLSKELHDLALREDKTLLGTGINPGFLMDLLPILLTAPCQRVNKIHVTRNMNSSSRRDAFQKKVGTGMTEEAFKEAIATKAITGHVGLVESIQMLGAALDLQLDHVEEFPPEPVIATEKIVTTYTTVQPGQVRGLKSRGVGQKGGDTIITLDFNAYADASPAYDEVRIEGLPNLQQRIDGGMPGDEGTVGMLINLVPLVISAPSGLLTMKDVPCPHNTERVWKKTT
ncbi:MAG: hypothetical protein ACFE89_01175 [Candidatus Hodarchaeota archaeon]